MYLGLVEVEEASAGAVEHQLLGWRVRGGPSELEWHILPVVDDGVLLAHLVRLELAECAPGGGEQRAGESGPVEQHAIYKLIELGIGLIHLYNQR